MKDLLKVSIITVCMDRVEHIKKTLPKNIEDNYRYGNIEFVLLDYNSSDNLKDWVFNNLRSEIKSGILKYYHTTEPNYFHRSHSRNLAFRLSTGDVVCNVDADNYVGKGYAEYINKAFQQYQNSFLVFNYNNVKRSQEDFVGRFCCFRSDFFKVHGYDENFANYGYEDLDLYYRLKESGLKELYFNHAGFFEAIPHEDSLRQKNEFFKKQLAEYFVCHISPLESKVICLFKDHSFHQGTLLTVNRNYTVRILEKGWIEGQWFRNDDRIYLRGEQQTELIHPQNAKTAIDISQSPFDTYIKITNQDLLNNLVTRHTSFTNFEQLMQNKSKRVVRANPEGFGLGTVTMNFDQMVTINKEETPIEI